MVKNIESKNYRLVKLDIDVRSKTIASRTNLSFLTAAPVSFQ